MNIECIRRFGNDGVCVRISTDIEIPTRIHLRLKGRTLENVCILTTIHPIPGISVSRGEGI